MSDEYCRMTVLELLNRKGNRLLKGASEEKISDFEETFGIVLPEEYREVLKYTNGADLFHGDITLYSLYDEDNPVKADCLIGKANSPIVKRDIPDELLVIGIYNFGDLVCLNLNIGIVVQWSHEDGEAFLEYPSIREWLISSFEEMDRI